MHREKPGIYKVEKDWAYTDVWVITVLCDGETTAHQLFNVFESENDAITYMAQNAPKMKLLPTVKFDHIHNTYLLLPVIP